MMGSQPILFHLMLKQGFKLYNFLLINILRIKYLDDGRPSGRCVEQMCSCNTSAWKGCADDAM